MKRIFLFLAAVAVLVSSCMKENAFENLDGNATIKAVASGTKTLVDGASVVWENTDVIKVVYQSIGQSADFSVKGSVAGSSANFTGTVNPEWTLEDKVHPYVVYPATAVTLEEGTGSTVISHTLPEVQTGTVTSGMNLSSALLSEEDLAAGTAEAVFHNALTLLQIVVPEGVASVELSAGYGLVGTAAFNVDNKDTQGTFNDEYDDDDNPIYETVYATGKLTIKTAAEKKTVTLSNGGEALEAKTHSVLVYPGNTTLALTMTGTDGATYNSSVDVALNAGEYRLIDLTKIFRMETQEEMFISPAGGECPMKIYATEAYDYNVTIENGEWLSYELPTRALINEAIVFKADENTTGATRTANVTITWGENTRTFKMTQKAVYTDFLNDENGNPIQWQETFGLYSDESLNSKLATFTNVFTIELSDDFSKGSYKLKNLFIVDLYYGEGYQEIRNKGGEYYANYDTATGKLTVLEANAVASYNFPGDIVLTYDSVNKTFSATTLTVTLLSGSAYYASGAARYIGGYSAAVKEEQEIPSSPYAYLCAQYTESLTGAAYGNPTPGTLTIELSDNDSYDLKMTFFGGTSTEVTVYANVSNDGKTLTTVKPAGYTNMGAFYESTLTLSDLSYGGPIWGTLKFDYPANVEYTAFKK